MLSKARLQWRGDTQRHLTRAPLLTAYLTIAFLSAIHAGCGPAASSAPGGALTGKLIVLVRPPNRNEEPISVQDPGALPVRDGGAMCLEVQLDQPAFAYLLWVDGSGQAVPLYPWNNESLEIKDIQQAPPTRRATNRVFSPQLGRNWTFGEGKGMETVLLLARRTPLPEGTSIGELLGTLPPPVPMRLPEELVVLTVAGGSRTVTTLEAKNRGDEKEAQAADEPLKQLMLQLAKDFELVRAVRFAHAEPDGSAAK